MNARRARILLPLAVAAAAIPLADSAGWSTQRARLDELVAEEMDRLGIPGLSAAAASDGRMFWSRGFGLADLENQTEATAQTVYRLASISKPITAVGVMQLAEAGKLALDEPIQRYVPEFPEKRWPVTCRLLLSHLGGIRHYQGQEAVGARHFETVREPLGQFSGDPLAFQPGTKFLYSTFGYNLLGRAIEVASGLDYATYIGRHIFAPAGMASTRVDDALAIIPHRAQGYSRVGNGSGFGVLRNAPLADTSNKIPGGGLCGTAEDLVRFSLAYTSNRLVSAKTRTEMQTVARSSRRMPVGYGLGWWLTRDGQTREVSHGGNQPRVSTLLYMRPETGVVIAVLCNLEQAPLLALTKRLADASTDWFA